MIIVSSYLLTVIAILQKIGGEYGFIHIIQNHKEHGFQIDFIFQESEQFSISGQLRHQMSKPEKKEIIANKLREIALTQGIYMTTNPRQRMDKMEILISDKGDLIHIDFEFLFDISPGGNLNIESATFKLTKEMSQIMGKEAFNYQVDLIVRAILAMRHYYEHFYFLITLMTNSCLGYFMKNLMKNFIERFHVQLKKMIWLAAKHMQSIIEDGNDKITTRWYDNIQYYQNGISKQYQIIRMEYLDDIKQYIVQIQFILFQNGSMITGNLFELVWGSVELALNILLYSRLKLPQKVMSHGLLRMSLVRECNYNFGVDTKIVRYVVASLLTPNIVTHFRKSNNSYHFIYGCFICFDALIVADILPMTDTIYAMILILRLFHLLQLAILQSIQTILKFIKAALSIKIHVKKAVKVQYNLLNQLNTTNSNIIISKKLEVSPPNSSQTTNASSLNEFESTQKSKRRPQFPNVYQIKVQTSKTTKINILIDEPDKFDLLFDQQLNMDRRMNLQIKLNLCAQVYQNLKKHYPCEWLLSQIAQYQAELLLLDQ